MVSDLLRSRSRGSRGHGAVDTFSNRFPLLISTSRDAIRTQVIVCTYLQKLFYGMSRGQVPWRLEAFTFESVTNFHLGP